MYQEENSLKDAPNLQTHNSYSKYSNLWATTSLASVFCSKQDNISQIEHGWGNNKLCQVRRFRLDIRINFFTEKGGQALERLPKERIKSPSLKVFKRCVDVSLGYMVLWRTQGCWVNGLIQSWRSFPTLITLWSQLTCKTEFRAFFKVYYQLPTPVAFDFQSNFWRTTIKITCYTGSLH